MSILTQRQVILAKVESTYNTDPTPVASTDAVLCEEVSKSHESARMIERKVVRPSLGQLQQVFGDTLMQISMNVELKGSGSAYSASNRPELDPLLRACGFSSTVDTTTGSETVTYVPVSDNSSHESVTIYAYIDGKLQKLTGCRGTVSFKMEAGQKGMASFTMTGHVATPTDVSLVDPTFNSTLPPAVLGAAFTVDSYSAIISQLTLDINNKITMPPSVNASDGFGELQIAERDIAGNFDPEQVLVATEAFDANWRSGKSMVLNTGDIGSTQYNKYSFALPGVYYRNVGFADRDGIASHELDFGALESSGDDEATLLFD